MMNPWKCLPVYLHIDGDGAQVGLWCEDCQLPSLVRFPIVEISERGVGVVSFVDSCSECGEFADGDEEDGDDGTALVCN